MENKIGIFSFFSGAGFLDLGFENSGDYKVLFVNEIHKPFMDIYKYSRKKMNIKEPEFGYHVDDIQGYLNGKLAELKDYYKKAKEKHEIVGFIGGPPCPDFSVGGKNKGEEGENGKLSKTYIQLICKIRPDFFLFENVKGLWRTKKHRQFYEGLKEKLLENGYLITENLINSIEYGVPQDRERIILIGFKKQFLKNNKYKANGSPYLWNFNWNSGILFDKNKIFNLPWIEKERFDEDSNKDEPVNVPTELTIEHWFNKNKVLEHPNGKLFFQPKAGLPKFQTIDEGDVSKKSYKRLHRWRFSPTAAYGNNEVHLHPYKARRISVAEALAIQSLPKEFEMHKDITLTNAFKAIGNGVPYLAAKGLGVTILKFIGEFISFKKYKSNGESYSSKFSILYKPTSKAEQLSVLEP